MKEYIERAAAEQAIHAIMPSMSTPDGAGANDEMVFAAQEMCVDALSAVHCLPAADVAEVRHGRWEFLGPNRLIKSCMCGTCSVCHVRSVYIVNTAICPNCGAPVKTLGEKFCQFCGTAIKEINIRSWKFNSVNEQTLQQRKF